MIRVAYILPFLNAGGSEESVLNLCKLRDKKNFTPFALAVRDGIMANEFREAGVAVFIQPNISSDPRAVIEILKTADIINANCFAYDDRMYKIIQHAEVPHLLTLRWLARLPVLDCMKICVSQAVYNMQLDKERCVVIHNGVDLTKFSFKPKPTREKVVITRICRPERCAPYFWIAMDRVLQDHSNVELWIVGGNGPSTERVKFMGVRRNIPDILAETDIFAYTPYPHQGAHDRVIIEAMAMGVPCVVSNVESVNESIRDGIDGFLVPFGDEDGFIQSLNTLITDRDLRVSFGMNALQRVRENYDVTIVTRRYEEIYYSVLSQ